MTTVTYLSDTNPDFRCLEDCLGKGAFGKLPDPHFYQSDDIERLRKYMELVATHMGIDGEIVANVLPDHVTLPTRYDDPAWYQVLQTLVGRIKAVSEGYGIDTSDFPYYSSIPTQLVNAQAVKLPDSTHSFLLFDSQIFLYCHLFAKAFALCIPVISDKDGLEFSLEPDIIKKRLCNTPECVDRIVDLLRALHKTGVPARAAPYIPDMAYARLSSVYRDGMELFVVAHEFGHVYANHLDRLLPRLCFSTQQYETNKSPHIQEFEADAIGLLLTVSAQTKQGLDAGLSYIGAELFFHALEMQEKASYMSEYRTDENYVSQSSETHPSHYERRMALRFDISGILGQSKQLESTLWLASQYEEIMTVLWSAMKGRLV